MRAGPNAFTDADAVPPEPLWMEDTAPVTFCLLPAEVATTSTFQVHEAPGARLTLSIEMKFAPALTLPMLPRSC